ncbi:MAG: type II toxin-antitoxin system VapC family toxin [Mycobacteriales bacterium]
MAERYVVDTGVLLRWYVPQPGFEHARQVRADLLAGDLALLAPQLALVEFADVLRRKALLPGAMDRADYLAAVRDVPSFGVEVRTPDLDALGRACALAVDRRIRLYDAVFVELALSTGVPLLTADARLARGVSGQVSTEVLRGVSFRA